ncbi:MAG: protein kinase [Acidobacteriota bacterium]|nr:protein kinase [Acidobacteriota bacterium]
MSRLDQIESLFHEARSLPPAIDPIQWTAEHCQGDGDMLEEVLSLLKAHQEMEREPAIAPEPEPGLPTAHFGAWRAVELLARGGMSVVYRAERADGPFEQTAALKIMAAFLAGPEFLRRFDTERRLLASLNHNHIARLLDGGVSSAGDPFLVTEYVHGQTIDGYCDQRKLDVGSRLRIFLQVCDAVDYAHRNLIVHRDLKPGNILVNQEGAVKLLDFGTASLMAAQDDVTVTRARMLTPRYASPEQLRGERLNIATDVYSLGVILYELLTGAWPFGDPSSVLSGLNRVTGYTSAKPPATAITDDAAKSRSISKEHLSGMLKGDLSPIVLKALENQPSLRYESVRQLAADLENFLEGRPVLARPQTVIYRARKFLRRRWLPVTAAAVFVLGLSLASVVSLRLAQAARAEARKAYDESQKSNRVTRFLRGMLNSSVRAGGTDVTVIQMLNEAEPGIEKSWKDDPLAEATLRASLGATYVTLEQRDRAKLQLQKALTLFRSLGRHVDAADTLLVLGINAQTVGESSAAVEHYGGALDELKLAGKDSPPALLFRVKVYLAGVLVVNFHRVKEARTLLDQALALATANPGFPSEQVSAALEHRGETMLEEGRFDEAEALFRQAIALNRSEFDAWSMLARSSSLQQNPAAAASFARRDYDLAAAYGQEDKAEAGVTWARYRAEAGEPAEALAQIREAMPVVRKYTRRGYLFGYYVQSAARVLNKAGRFEEAAQYARHSLDALHEDQIPELHPVSAEAMEDLGTALRGLKRKREAIPALEKALDVYRQLGPAYAKTADRVQKILTQAKAG